MMADEKFMKEEGELTHWRCRFFSHTVKYGCRYSWLTEDKTLTVRSSKNPNHGKKAVTHYKVLKSNKNSSLLKVNLETGRKNQIRVHMQELGHPIVGDKKNMDI